MAITSLSYRYNITVDGKQVEKRVHKRNVDDFLEMYKDNNPTLIEEYTPKISFDKSTPSPDAINFFPQNEDYFKQKYDWEEGLFHQKKLKEPKIKEETGEAEVDFLDTFKITENKTIKDFESPNNPRTTYDNYKKVLDNLTSQLDTADDERKPQIEQAIKEISGKQTEIKDELSKKRTKHIGANGSYYVDGFGVEIPKENLSAEEIQEIGHDKISGAQITAKTLAQNNVYVDKDVTSPTYGETLPIEDERERLDINDIRRINEYSEMEQYYQDIIDGKIESEWITVADAEEILSKGIITHLGEQAKLEQEAEDAYYEKYPDRKIKDLFTPVTQQEIEDLKAWTPGLRNTGVGNIIGYLGETITMSGFELSKTRGIDRQADFEGRVKKMLVDRYSYTDIGFEEAVILGDYILLTTREGDKKKKINLFATDAAEQINNFIIKNGKFGVVDKKDLEDKALIANLEIKTNSVKKAEDSKGSSVEQAYFNIHERLKLYEEAKKNEDGKILRLTGKKMKMSGPAGPGSDPLMVAPFVVMGDYQGFEYFNQAWDVDEFLAMDKHIDAGALGNSKYNHLKAYDNMLQQIAFSKFAKENKIDLSIKENMQKFNRGDYYKDERFIKLHNDEKENAAIFRNKRISLQGRLEHKKIEHNDGSVTYYNSYGQEIKPEDIITKKEYEKAIAELDKTDPYHQKFLDAVKSQTIQEEVTKGVKDFIANAPNSLKNEYREEFKNIQQYTDFEISESVMEKDAIFQEAKSTEKIVLDTKESIKNTEEKINELTAKYDIKFTKDKEGNQVVDTSDIENHIEKNIYSKYPTKEKQEKEQQRIIDSFNLPSEEEQQKELNARILKAVPTEKEINNKRSSLEKAVANGTLTVDEANAKWDSYVKSITDTEEKIKNEYIDELQGKFNNANAALDEYTNSLDVLKKELGIEAQDYFDTEYAEVKKYFEEAGELYKQINFYNNKHNELIEYHNSLTARDEIVSSKLNSLQWENLTSKIGVAESRKIFTALNSPEWWNIKSTSVVGNFMMNFGEAMQGLGDGYYEFKEDLLEKAIPNEKFRNFVKDAMTFAQMFTPMGRIALGLGALFDKNSRIGGVYDHKTGENISRFRSISKGWGDYVSSMNEYMIEPKSWDELKRNGSWTDWAEYGISMGMEQVPVITTIVTTGGWAIPLLGVNSAGGYYKNAYEDNQLWHRTNGQYGLKQSWGQMTIGAAVAGLSESLSEVWTGRTVGLTMNSLRRFGKGAAKDAIQTSSQNYISKVFNPIKKFGTYTVATAGEWAGEGASEVLATMGQNFASRYISGDKTVHLFDDVEESFWNGVGLSMGLTSPRMAADLVSPFAENSDFEAISSMGKSLHEITNQIADIKGYGPMFKDITNEDERKAKLKELEKQYVDLVVKINDTMGKSSKLVDFLKPDEKKELLDLWKKNQIDQQELDRIQSEGKLPKAEINKKINQLNKNIEQRNKKKEKILNKYNPEQIDAYYNHRLNVMQQMAKMTEKMGGPKVNFIELNDKEYKEAVKRHESMKKGKTEEQIENIVAESEAELEYWQNVAKTSKNKNEVELAEQMIKDLSGDLTTGINILNSSSAGVMQPILGKNSKGEIVIKGMNILINKDAVVTHGMFNTTAHEFIHAVFANTLKSDPAMRAILGKQLEKVIEGKGITFAEGAESRFRARIAKYKKNKQGEEMMAILAEMMLDGDITINNTVAEKLVGIFRRFAQQYLGYDIRFRKGKKGINDLKNFLTDFHHSIKKNRPNKAIARMMARGAKGDAFKDAKFEDIDGQSEFSEVVNNALKDDVDLITNYDQHSKNKDGSKKYKNKEEFETKGTNDRTQAYLKLMDNGLDKMILMGDKAFDPKGLPKEEQKEYIRKVKENLQDRFLQNFDPALNDSIAGWLFGANGVLYYAKKDIQKDYIEKEGGTGKRSLDRQTAEGQSYADIIPGDAGKERRHKFESEEILRQSETGTEVNSIKVKTALQLSDKTIKTVERVSKDVDYSNNKLGYKNVNSDLTSVEKVKRKNKKTGKIQLKNPTKESDVKPTGILYEILESLSNEIGVSPLRILANQDLNAKQRDAGKAWIAKLSINEDGSFNDILLKLLPEGQDRSGKATGIADTVLGQFYDKGERAAMADTGSAAGLPDQLKRDNITKEEFLNLFGINADGSVIKGDTKANKRVDAAIRQLITQTATTLTNQELRISGNAGHKIGDGKSLSMFNNTKSNETIEDQIVKAINSYGDASFDLMTEGMNPALLSVVEQMALENYLASPGGYNDVIANFESTPPELKKLFKPTKKGDKVRYVGPKLFEIVDGNSSKGLPGVPIITLAKGAKKLIEQTHPNLKTEHLMYFLGFKDSGTYKIDGKVVMVDGKPARSIRTPNGKDFLFLEDSSRMDDAAIAKEEKYLIDNGLMTKAEIDAMKNFKHMEFKGKIREILLPILQETNLVKKQEMLQNARAQIEEINESNKAAMKYFSIKLKQAYNNKTLSALDIYLIGKFQTNIVEGTRALSTLDYVYLVKGPQVGKMNKPQKTKKTKDGKVPNEKYDTQLEAYYDSWRECEDFNEAFKIAKKKFPNLKGNALLDKTIGLLRPKNEHLKPSADTHARRADYVFSGKTDVDNITSNHKTLYAPAFICDIMDSKIKIDGKLVDNKVSLEGELRLIKFLKGRQKHVFNINGKTAAQHLNDIEGFSTKANKFLKDNMPVENEKRTKQLADESGMSSSYSMPPDVKGASIFDFDDTLAFTKSGVRVTVPNIDGKPKPKRKVIFLAGGAGSGKSNIVKKLNLEKQGFKIVNSDISLEWLKKNSGLPEDMRDLTPEQRSELGRLGAQSRKIARKKMMKYQGEGNGVVVDGTGGSVKQMQKLVKEFQDKGYDVSMLFVETSLDTALDRNRARKERSLLDVIVRRNHEAVQGNKDTFKEMFGDNFMEINTDNMEIDDPVSKDLASKMDKFVSGHERLRLDATEFAELGDDILQRGGKFDFSEFDQVVEGRPGPLLGKALERAKRFGTKDIFVLTARTPRAAKAIQQFLKSQGLDIPLKNITGLANSTGEAKAKWVLDKFAEGYNDMYFADDATQNVAAVKEVLDQLDIKSDVVQAKMEKTNRKLDDSDSMESKIIEPSIENQINTEFNDMIERKKGIDSKTIISEAEARKRGSQPSIIRFLKSLYIPPSAEDFKGLMYYFVGKGKQGDMDLKWFKEKLFDPFARGIRSWNAYKQNMVNEYKALKKQFPKVAKSLNKTIPGSVFSVDTAVRVYLWNKHGHDIPGISESQKRELIRYVENNANVKAFAEGLSTITRSKEGYPPPTENWSVSSIPGDMNNLVNKIGRKQFLQEWIDLKNIIFNKDNLNKIEAAYGSWFVEALKNILYRMENGGNRLTSPDSTVNMFTEWINGSVGAVMFFNMRSALLQTISTVNFINWSDNNIFKASAAFANQVQFWKDFVMLFNSDQLKQRRGGLQTDVSASELAKAFAEGKRTPAAVISYLLQKGFTPTQIADSFAIAFGGASFYRNRLNKYKKEGMSNKEAHDQAMLDFQEIAEETQQSSREDLVSQQQASILGRMVLAFQNVTMQMGRLTKKALSDLRYGRGDWKTNVSKILYYGMVQNIVFASLQTALAAIMWGDDEEEIENRTVRTMNQALDSFLRGTGLYGALLSTLKNTIIQWHKQKNLPRWKRDKWDIAQELVNLSPPIGSKMRKIMSAFDTELYNEGVGEKVGWSIENPNLRKWSSIIEAVTNIPLARVVNKANNLEEAITGNHLMWQRVALVLGWNRWDVGVKDEEIEKAKEEIKIEKKEKKEEEKKIKKEEEKKKKEEEKKKEEKEKKEKGIKTVRCSGIRSNGRRCGNTTETNKKSWKCVHHAEFKDGSDTDGDGKKEYRCTATKSNGQRCKNKTENTNKKCYAHQ